jgi:hypothetical protein
MAGCTSQPRIKRLIACAKIPIEFTQTFSLLTVSLDPQLW